MSEASVGIRLVAKTISQAVCVCGGGGGNSLIEEAAAALIFMLNSSLSVAPGTSSALEMLTA